MKDNFYFMDEYFLGIEFRFPSGQIDPPLLWFNPGNFKKVLAVCQEKGLGVQVIEVYKGGYADTLISDDFGGNAFDSGWYLREYDRLLKQYCSGEDAAEVMFAAWYLEKDDDDSESNSDNESRSEPGKNKEPKKGFWSRIRSRF
ncbi:MAG: hypothetical protein ACO1N0_10880 [Fluviicola sp.]